jgi:hypothetical protein
VNEGGIVLGLGREIDLFFRMSNGRSLKTKGVRARIVACFWWKAVGATVAISVFFVAYFYVMYHPVFPVRVMPVLPADAWVAVLPWSVWIYFSLWVYICMPLTLMANRRALWHYFLGAFLLAVLGMTIFLIFPTAVPDLPIDWSQYPRTLSFLKSSAVTGNACPSLHVAYSVFAAFWLAVMLCRIGVARIWHLGNVVWCLAILFSTLSTKQHVLLDLIVGAPLGALAFGLNFRWVRKTEVNL